jgi:hypothetical protein
MTELGKTTGRRKRGRVNSTTAVLCRTALARAKKTYTHLVTTVRLYFILYR